MMFSFIKLGKKTVVFKKRFKSSKNRYVICNFKQKEQNLFFPPENAVVGLINTQKSNLIHGNLDLLIVKIHCQKNNHSYKGFKQKIYTGPHGAFVEKVFIRHDNQLHSVLNKLNEINKMVPKQSVKIFVHSLFKLPLLISFSIYKNSSINAVPLSYFVSPENKVVVIFEFQTIRKAMQFLAQEKNIYSIETGGFDLLK